MRAGDRRDRYRRPVLRRPRGLQGPTGDASPLSQFGGLPKAAIDGGPLSVLAAVVDKADHKGRQPIRGGQEGEAWAALLRLPDERLGAALAALAADSLRVRPRDEFHPVVTALARHYGITVPPLLAGDQADLEDAVNAALAAEAAESEASAEAAE